MRDTRLDIIRGVAMVTIGLNHVSEMIFELSGWHRLLKLPTPTYYGFSSAAEIFVMLSGYMVGLVYMAKPDGVQRVLLRSVKLYLFSIAVLVLVIPFALDASLAFRAHTGLREVMADPWAYMVRFLTLQASPRLINVLQLYVVLMPLAAVAMVAAKRRPWLIAAPSIAVYAVMQLDKTSEVWRWNIAFHPAAWQLLFILPMLAGAHRFHERLFGWIDAHPRAIWALGAMLAAAAAIRLADMFGGPAVPWTSRPRLGAVSVVHSFVLVAFYACVLSRMGGLQKAPPLSWLALIGRNSLNCFMASILATYSAGWLWEQVLPTYSGYLLACMFVLGVMLATAAILDHNKPGSKRMRDELPGALEVRQQ